MYRVLKEMAIEVPEQHAITSGEINFLIGPTPGGGGGGLSYFVHTQARAPASTVLPQKLSESSSTPKKYLKF